MAKFKVKCKEKTLVYEYVRCIYESTAAGILLVMPGVSWGGSTLQRERQCRGCFLWVGQLLLRFFFFYHSFVI